MIQDNILQEDAKGFKGRSSYVPHPKSLLPLSKASQDSPLILQVTRFLTDITISYNLQNIFSALLAIINEDSC